jgi:hypothetical protein
MSQAVPTAGAAVTVVDAIMGSGKTTWIIEEMRRRYIAGLFDASATRFLYIATTLDEVERIKAACPEMGFVDPSPEQGRKLTGLNRLLREGRNICSTHALFHLINGETYQALLENRYVLVIDEVLQCVSHLPLPKDDKRALFENGMVYVDGRGRLRWNHQRWPDYSGRFSDIRDLCDNGNLAWHRGKFLIWELPIDMLACFAETFILTYLFRGSLMRSYFDLHGVAYQVMSLHGGELCDRSGAAEREIKERLRASITVVDDPRLNAVGNPTGKEQPLSASWFDRKAGSGKSDGEGREIKALKLATENFFRHHAGTPSGVNMWTTFKKIRPQLKGRGYAKGFVPVNCKATNEFIGKRSLAYLANVFLNPIEVGYFQDQGVEIDQDAYALGEMLQWVWRSQIRRGDPIVLFVPSERMRRLFLEWLHSDAADRVDDEVGPALLAA